MRILTIALLLIMFSGASAQNQGVKIALLKYSGGGDWYANPTSLPNLITFCNNNLKTNITPNHQLLNWAHPKSLISRLFIAQAMEILFFRKARQTI
jgi:hypothetical protein